MPTLSSQQKKRAALIGLLTWAALLAVLLGWLAFHGEEVTENRIAQTPSATVSLVEKPVEVPQSWTTEQLATPDAPTAEPPVAEAPAPDAATPLAEQPAAVEQATPPAVAEPQPEPPVAEKEKPVAEAPKPAEPAATETVSEPEPQAMPEPVTPSVVEPQTQPTAKSSSLTLASKPNWHKNARIFDQTDARPRIALIISDLGFASGATQEAIQAMPADVTLGFSSLAPSLENWMAQARAAGHETLLTVPMEPENYPKNDPGPNTLLTALPDKDNMSRLEWALSRADSYVGIIPSMGGKFVMAESKLAPVLDTVAQRELMMIDGTRNKNSLIAPLARLNRVPFVRVDILIDAAAARNAIDIQLETLEKLAREKGQAVGVALPYPVTFERLKPWVETLEGKGLVLAPITALASEEIPVSAAAPAPVEPETTVPTGRPAIEIPVAKGEFTTIKSPDR